jgi:hypothetical protein
MIAKITINPETLEVILDDSNLILNYIKKENGLIQLEISKPDPEPVYSYTPSPILN